MKRKEEARAVQQRRIQAGPLLKDVRGRKGRLRDSGGVAFVPSGPSADNDAYVSWWFRCYRSDDDSFERDRRRGGDRVPTHRRRIARGDSVPGGALVVADLGRQLRDAQISRNGRYSRPSRS